MLDTSSKMNPKDSAAFISSVAVDVKINSNGIKKVASEVSVLKIILLWKFLIEKINR